MAKMVISIEADSGFTNRVLLDIADRQDFKEVAHKAVDLIYDAMYEDVEISVNTKNKGPF